MNDLIDKKEYFSLVHTQARIRSGKSQDFMARELSVSKKTIQNWEKGASSPSFFQSLEWFKVLNINPFPYYLKLIYSHDFIELNMRTKDEKVEEMFDKLVKNLPHKC